MKNTGLAQSGERNEVYAALYALNCGIQQFVNALGYLERVGLDVQLLEQYRRLAEEIRAGTSQKVMEVMAEIERSEWSGLEKKRLGVRKSAIRH